MDFDENKLMLLGKANTLLWGSLQVYDSLKDIEKPTEEQQTQLDNAVTVLNIFMGIDFKALATHYESMVDETLSKMDTEREAVQAEKDAVTALKSDAVDVKPK